MSTDRNGPISTAADQADTLLADLHQRYFRTRDSADREELLRRYARLSYSLAGRLGDRAGDPDDVRQTAMIGLLKALERYDPNRGVAFTTFAWATISGELKRYSRDSTWALRVPRHLQERYLLVAHVLDELSNSLGRSPTMTEVADAAALTIDEVVEALELHHARRPASIDVPAHADAPSVEPAAPAAPMTAAEDRVVLAQLLEHLPERERRIVWLRFGCEMSQSEIAAEVGLSQMQVSRLLARSLADLRERASQA